jgi:hypothetical protein
MKCFILLSSWGETKIIRAIEEKRDELEIIKGYIENNVGQFQKEYEKTVSFIFVDEFILRCFNFF